MKKIVFILSLISTLFFVCCNKAEIKSEVNYNDKANELIGQIIKQNKLYKCNCLLEIPKESLITIRERDDPNHNYKEILAKKLKLNDLKSMDSLEKLSNNFQFNQQILKGYKLKLIKRDMLAKLDYQKRSEICPGGVFYIIKPIFDKYYKTAVIEFGIRPSCLPFISVYKFKNDKWVEEKTAGNSSL